MIAAVGDGVRVTVRVLPAGGPAASVVQPSQDGGQQHPDGAAGSPG